MMSQETYRLPMRYWSPLLSPTSMCYQMWATGFDTCPADDLENMHKEALAWMQQTAQDKRCALAGSLATKPAHGAQVEESHPWRNRFYFVRDDGTFSYYDKRNLFSFGGEHLHYSAGSERTTVDYHGARFMLQTCFDLRFPETARNSLAAPYDILLYVANWPVPRRSAWDALLTARAIENQTYVVGVNRTGTDPNCQYDGGSAVIDPYGTLLHRIGNKASTFTFRPDLEKIQSFRKKFKVLR